MKVFLSHAPKDGPLAQELTKQLSRAHFDVWNSEEEIEPGENWAKKTGEALDDSELLVILLTPQAMKSTTLRRDIEFAIGGKKFADRVFTVYVGPTFAAGKDVPWILMRLPFVQVESARKFREVVKAISAQFDGPKVSHSNA